MIVGVLVVHLLSLIYGVPFPSWILWLVGLLAVSTWAYAGFTSERKKMFELKIEKLELEIEIMKEKLRKKKDEELLDSERRFKKREEG